MYIKNKKGQSTVEYVLLVTAVVAVIIVLVAGKNGGFQTTLNTTLNGAINEMNTLSGSLSDSHTLSPKPTSSDNTTPPYSVNPAAGA